MKVVFITKQGWWIIVAICVFVLGNCVLLYRFINKNSIADQLEKTRLKELTDRYLANVGPDSKLHDIAEKVKKLRKKPAQSDVFIPSLPLAQRGDQVKENVGLNRTTDEAAISPKRDAIATKNTASDFVAAVLVIACNRPTVKRCLDFLLQYRPSSKQFPIIVSQDCGDQPTADVIKSYGTQVSFIQQPDLSDVQGVPANMRSMMGYYKISRHYKWALGQAFDHMGFDTVLIVEDDLDIGKCLARGGGRGGRRGVLPYKSSRRVASQGMFFGIFVFNRVSILSFFVLIRVSIKEDIFSWTINSKMFTSSC